MIRETDFHFNLVIYSSSTVSGYLFIYALSRLLLYTSLCFVFYLTDSRLCVFSCHHTWRTNFQACFLSIMMFGFPSSLTPSRSSVACFDARMNAGL